MHIFSHRGKLEDVKEKLEEIERINKMDLEILDDDKKKKFQEQKNELWEEIKEILFEHHNYTWSMTNEIRSIENSAKAYREEVKTASESSNRKEPEETLSNVKKCLSFLSSLETETKKLKRIEDKM